VVPRIKPPLKVRNEQGHGIKATAGVEQLKNQRSWDNSPPTMKARPLSSTDRPLKSSIASGVTKQRCQVVNVGRTSVVPVEPRQSTSNSRDLDRPLKNSMASGATKKYSRPVYEKQEIVEPRQGVVKKESTNVAIKQRQG
jgi:hypothetical protein